MHASWAIPAPMVPAPTTPTRWATPRSPPPEFGLSLLEERIHALDAVLGRHRQLVQPAFLIEAGAQGGLVGGEHGLLGEPDGDRRVPGDPLRELQGAVKPFTRAGDLVHHPQSKAFSRADPR